MLKLYQAWMALPWPRRWPQNGAFRHTKVVQHGRWIRRFLATLARLRLQIIIKSKKKPIYPLKYAGKVLLSTFLSSGLIAVFSSKNAADTYQMAFPRTKNWPV
jgi:hypothetical protein